MQHGGGEDEQKSERRHAGEARVLTPRAVQRTAKIRPPRGRPSKAARPDRVDIFRAKESGRGETRSLATRTVEKRARKARWLSALCASASRRARVSP
jgi:hypothetical protein